MFSLRLSAYTFFAYRLPHILIASAIVVTALLLSALFTALMGTPSWVGTTLGVVLVALKMHTLGRAYVPVGNGKPIESGNHPILYALMRYWFVGSLAVTAYYVSGAALSYFGVPPTLTGVIALTGFCVLVGIGFDNAFRRHFAPRL